MTTAVPTITKALHASLVRGGHVSLAEQVESARVYGLCGCGMRGCMSLHLQPHRDLPCPGEYVDHLPDAFVSVGSCGGRLFGIDDEALDAEPETAARLGEVASLRGVLPEW
jgi:hypothetical protein